ncbi:MAG TPA: deoxyguanosinetriphosphate triphosphohydrolase [candidate division Zixibacteria bacterium]|nr:deoxyguanosinetriphosphate triphosphohydrolase [candidate division Zixibacteria bacterium]HBZ01442.1 deoxyguanosinetriphosphate triphosphohydrolase [candidate division Zixibacteria bacterium]
MFREEYEKREMQFLAPYAMKSCETRGRRHPEAKHPYRTEFQRDRDRIVHSTAFRRLEYKTQVFVNHEGDHFRTRLTHTLEVAIIARSIARSLRLNEDLTEAIALAHDLGHTPFGHSGEEALNELLKDKGGFEHNRQCIRVVDYLERRYPEFDGLNLTFEVREGILKHHSDYDNPQLDWELGLGGNPSLECQIVNLADEIAYNCHDVDDGLASGVLNEAQLSGIEIWQEHFKYITSQFPEADEQMRRHTIIRRLIDHLVTDLTEQSEKNIESDTPESPEDVRKGKRHLITFSEAIARQSVQLKLFLYQNMYRHYRMVRMSEKAKRIISELFNAYMGNIDVLPDHIKGRMDNELRHMVVADYIAGMTDRFASAEYKKLVDPFEKV